jgi:phosphoribosylamine--glycine ligase
LVDGRVVTTGGRVLTVTGLGGTFAEARARAYAAVEAISFDGAQYRGDIALRAEEWEARGGSASSSGRARVGAGG